MQENRILQCNPLSQRTMATCTNETLSSSGFNEWGSKLDDVEYVNCRARTCTNWTIISHMKLCESGTTPWLLPALAEETNQRLWKSSASSHADLWARWYISAAASDSASLMYSITPQSLQVLYSLCIFVFSLSPNVKPCISTCNMRWCGRVAAWTLSMSVIRKRKHGTSIKQFSMVSQSPAQFIYEMVQNVDDTLHHALAPYLTFELCG